MGEARPSLVLSLPCLVAIPQQFGTFQAGQSLATAALDGQRQQPGLWLSPLSMGCWISHRKFGQRTPPFDPVQYTWREGRKVPFSKQGLGGLTSQRKTRRGADRK